MGVYFSSAIAWGLRVKMDDIPGEETYPDEWLGWGSDSILPEGYAWAEGGDHMNGENLSTIIHPKGMWLKISDTMESFGDVFGVFKLEEKLGSPTEEQDAFLARFAKEHGVPADIGWFAISSVG